MFEHASNPKKCPQCGSTTLHYESQAEYTGGGLGDTWIEYCCEKCGYTWRFGQKHEYF